MAKHKPQTTAGEIGFGGSKVLWGRYQEEYLPDLMGAKWFEAVDKMRKSDGMVSAIEQVITLPILSAKWRVEPFGGEDADEVDQAAAQHIEDNLFGGMTITWADLVRQLMGCMWYGFVFAEKVFELRDGMVCWRKIAPRKPATRFRWLLDDTGGLEGVEQMGWAPNGWRHVTVPIDKLLVITYRGEYGNHDGFSLMRPAWKHWLMADEAYRKYNLGMDKALIPVPIGKYPLSASEDQRSTFEQSLRSYYATHGAYFMLPSVLEGQPKWELELLPPNTSFMGVLDYVAHHRTEMARSVLAQFLMLGSGKTGSFALSSDQSDVFLQSLNAFTSQICETFNRFAIKQLCDYNWENLGGYPKLVCENISGVDIASVSKALESVVAAGFVRPGVADEEVVRTLLDLPPVPEEQVQSRTEQESNEAVNPPANRLDAIAASRQRRAEARGEKPAEADDGSTD